METNDSDSPTVDPLETRRSPPGGLRRRLAQREPVHRSVWALLVAWVLTLVAIAIAVEAGTLLGLFGLGWVALIVGCVAIFFGAAVAPRVMLPLSATVTALVLPAAGVTLTQQPVDRSVGLLVIRPSTADEIDGKTFRRGVGSILLDLRSMRSAAGEKISVRAQADMGRVIVALPRARCISTSVQSRLSGTPGGPAEAALLVLGLRDDELNAGWDFDPAAWLPPSQGWQDLSAPLIAYGKPRPGGDFVRRAGAATPQLRLDLRGTAPSVVRDYPDYVGPLTPASETAEQVGDASWPRSVRLPLRPSELAEADAWRHTWTPQQVARGVPAAWAKWEKATIAAQRTQARRAAGACASPEELANYWSTSRFEDYAGVEVWDKDGHLLAHDQVERAIRVGVPIYDELFAVPLTAEQARERLRRAQLPLAYYLSVNGLGEVERQQLDRNELLGPSTMTAGNPGGAR